MYTRVFRFQPMLSRINFYKNEFTYTINTFISRVKHLISKIDFNKFRY